MYVANDISASFHVLIALNVNNIFVVAYESFKIGKFVIFVIEGTFSQFTTAGLSTTQTWGTLKAILVRT